MVASRFDLRDLGELSWTDRDVAGVKAATLGELSGAGFPVPEGFVLTTAAMAWFLEANRLSADSPSEAIRQAPLPPELGEAFQSICAKLGGTSVAVRSSAAAEDLSDASFAGQYETVLGVREIGAIAEAVKQCWASAVTARAQAYAAASGKPLRSGMAVLIQRLVMADSAGVAFTANPLTGSRDEVVIDAVKGTGERLVAGQSIGDEWIVRGSSASARRSSDGALTSGQALAVADLARRVELQRGSPQDVEWALSGGKLFLLQARPMTALPEPVDWTPPIPGGWMRNVRYGEWLPDPVTPLFETWLLPRIDRSLIAMATRLTGIRTDGPTYVIVNGWCFSNQSGRTSMLTFVMRALAALRVMSALALQFTRPAMADKVVVKPLEKRWRDDVLPRYRALVAAGEDALGRKDSAALVRFVDDLADLVGDYIATFNCVGGSAWRLEVGLARFYRRHLWPVIGGSHQELLCGLDMGSGHAPPHLVQSLDWVAPTLGDISVLSAAGTDDRKTALHESRLVAESRCRAALAIKPMLLRQFEELLGYAQRYAVLREEQCADLTLGWPVARRAALQLGEALSLRGVIAEPKDVFFLTYDELMRALEDASSVRQTQVTDGRRRLWERQRKLSPPLVVGRLPKYVSQMIVSSLEIMRTPVEVAADAIRGLPASPGRAAGPVRVIRAHEDFAKFQPGDVLVTQAAMPAWTPLFPMAAAVVTDTGTLAAHASLVAREVGIPAVVGTGDATARLRDGQIVTVDGSAGLVEPEQSSVST